MSGLSWTYLYSSWALYTHFTIHGVHFVLVCFFAYLCVCLFLFSNWRASILYFSGVTTMTYKNGMQVPPPEVFKGSSRIANTLVPLARCDYFLFLLRGTIIHIRILLDTSAPGNGVQTGPNLFDVSAALQLTFSASQLERGGEGLKIMKLSGMVCTTHSFCDFGMVCWWLTMDGCGFSTWSIYPTGDLLKGRGWLYKIAVTCCYQLIGTQKRLL